MTAQKTYDRACDWIILLDSDTATATERAEFVRWLNQEPENAIAFEEMSQLWAKIGTLGPLGAEPEELFPATPCRLRPASKSQHFSRWVLATVCGIVVMCGSIILGTSHSGLPTQQQFVTALNQKHKLTAPDGSVIQMGLMSAIELNYSSSMREVHMQRGSIQFSVAHDERRPFVVNLGEISVWAVGTKFTITGDAGRIEVQVIEGSVRFSSNGAKQNSSGALRASQQPATVLLTAGQLLNYSAETGFLQLKAFQPGALTH